MRTIEEARAYQREYYHRNKERTKEAVERCRKANPDKYRAYNRKAAAVYRKKHKDRTKKTYESWKERNPEYWKEYYRKNKYKINERKSKNRREAKQSQTKNQ